MNHRMFTAGLLGVALVALTAGCAETGALARPSDLSGTWHGTYGWIRPDLYDDEARITLQIREDGTFSATVTPNGGGNNLAKPTTWSGTVVVRGNRVTLRSNGNWGWLTLARSEGGNVLYGVAHDPAIESAVMLKFDRDGSQNAPAASVDPRRQ
jgi:hypothetical protein